MKHNTKLLSKIMPLLIRYKNDERLNNLGISMAEMKNTRGFPPDMFVKETNKIMNLSEDEWVYVINVYCNEIIKHKRESGAEEKSLDRTRINNQKIMADFIRTGELGVY